MAQIFMLKGLPPDVHDRLSAIAADLGALEQQAVDDLILSGREGVDVTTFQVQVSNLKNQIAALQAELMTMEASDEAAWKAQAALVKTALLNTIDQMAAARSGSLTSLHYNSLWLAFGVSLVVAGASYAIYAKKKRR